MEHSERLKQCKICLNREFDFKQGIICGKTKVKANFEGECPIFNRDYTVEPTREVAKENVSILDYFFIATVGLMHIFGFLLSYKNFYRADYDASAAWFCSMVSISFVFWAQIKNLNFKKTSVIIFGSVETLYLASHLLDTWYEEFAIILGMTLFVIIINLRFYIHVNKKMKDRAIDIA